VEYDYQLLNTSLCHLSVCVSSLNDDCSRALVGYARGQLTMWDLTSGKLLRTITDAHCPGAAVLSVKFTDDRTVAVMSDSGGSVFRLEFKRVIGVRTCDSQCLFSGSRGEVHLRLIHITWYQEVSSNECMLYNVSY